MSERVIAICSPELHGDMLWSVAAARALAARHNCRADFWLSSRGWNAADLLEAQTFVRKAILEPSWHLEADCTQVEEVNYVEVRLPPGESHVIQNASLHGYEMVYNLGFSKTMTPDNSLLDYFCALASVPRQSHVFDLPEDCPKESLPDGPFVALESRSHAEAGRTGWYEVFRDFVRHCPIPVVEIGRPTTALATDLGAIDRTRPGFLEMAGVISRCKYYIGNISAPLVIADAFPDVIRIGVTEGAVNLTHCTQAGGKNFYPRASVWPELMSYIEESK